MVRNGRFSIPNIRDKMSDLTLSTFGLKQLFIDPIKDIVEIIQGKYNSPAPHTRFIPFSFILIWIIIAILYSEYWTNNGCFYASLILAGVVLLIVFGIRVFVKFKR